jgi:hypothetical protein
MSEPSNHESQKTAHTFAGGIGAALGDEKLLTRIEAAEFLRKSTRTIDYYVARTRGMKRINKTHRKEQKKGPVLVRGARVKLPFIKIGGEVFFMLGDLRRFRDERKVAA